MRPQRWRFTASALLWLAALALSAFALRVTARGALPPDVGRFLVAGAGMSDPRFRRTVVLLVRYGDDGALGLVVNRAAGLSLSQAFPQVDEMQGVTARLWLGGPVHRGVAAVLLDAAEPPDDSTPVLDSLYFSRSVSLMRTLASTPGGRYRIYAGYAGWAPGQLDAELAQKAWSVLPATPEQVFSDDEERLWRDLDTVAAGTWVQRRDHQSWPVTLSRVDRGHGPAPTAPWTPRSVVLSRHVHAEKLAVAVNLSAQDHGAAAHGAVLHQFAVARGAVQQDGVVHPAPRATYVGRLEHLSP